MEIYEKILVRNSGRDSQITEFKGFSTGFNLSSTQITVRPPAGLLSSTGLLQDCAHGEEHIVLISLISSRSHEDNLTFPLTHRIGQEVGN